MNTFKEYGKPDIDVSAYLLLLDTVKDMDVKYIMHYDRVPVSARPCRSPGLLKIQALLSNNKVITVVQESVQHKPRVLYV